MKKKTHFIGVHEASHALIAWFFGMILQLVSIRPGALKNGPEYSGLCKAFLSDGSRAESIHFKAFSVPLVYELMAGRAATDILCPEIPRGNSHKTDFKRIAELKAIDETTLEMARWRLENPGADVEAFYQNFKKPIEEIIRSKKGTRAIRALARVLLKHGQISGAEAVKIFEKAWGQPRPPWALPAEQHKNIIEKGEKSFPDCMNEILLYVRILKEIILPLRDDEKNTAIQNKILQDISDKLLHIQFLAIGPEKADEN